MARPKKTVKDTLPKDYKERFLELYTKGASNVEIKALIYQLTGSFSDSLWHRWLEEEEEFSSIIKIGRLASQAWWEKQGRENISTKQFNATLWYMNIKNRFREDWKEDQQPTGKVIVEIETKEEGKKWMPSN